MTPTTQPPRVLRPLRRVMAVLALAVVPALGAGVALGAAATPTAHAQTDRPPATGKIDLNRATAAELVGLPGIGPARAEAVIALRERLGGFRRVEDLLRVRGIGRATLAKIRPMVTVGPRPRAGRAAD